VGSGYGCGMERNQTSSYEAPRIVREGTLDSLTQCKVGGGGDCPWYQDNLSWAH
jgi:hypothetical protein